MQDAYVLWNRAAVEAFERAAALCGGHLSASQKSHGSVTVEVAKVADEWAKPILRNDQGEVALTARRAGVALERLNRIRY
eukprot:9964745-Alexandrium_andersonii.AAC.1